MTKKSKNTKKTNRDFEDKWNRFCRKFCFICCCECNLDDNDDNIDYVLDAPRKIAITEN